MGTVHTPLLEVAVDSVEDAEHAATCGASRLEVVRELHTQGLTADGGMIREIRRRVSVPLMAMIRCRAGDFCFAEAEGARMVEEVLEAGEAGARGVVIGALTSTGYVDRGLTRRLVGAAKEWGMATVFHRAFDFTPDASESLEELVSLGVTRILTAGIGTWATPGEGEGLQSRIERVRALVEQAAGRIEVMPGGGVRPNNAKLWMNGTGCWQLHSACRGQVGGGGGDGGRVGGVPCAGGPQVDGEMVRAMVREMDEFLGARNGE